MKRARRIGRGGKKGSTSGRGSKGQRARAGRRFKPLIRELIKRYPKLRGHRSKLFKKPLVEINLVKIEKAFKDGDTVSPKALFGKKLISFPGNKIPLVKVLASGELTKPLVFEDCLLSKSAKEKIEKAGGTIRS